MFRDWRPEPSVNERRVIWHDELAVAVLFYVLTICTWQTRRADLIFVVLALIFLVLRIIGGWGMGQRTHHRDATCYSWPA
jgi:hypothetical protein